MSFEAMAMVSHLNYSDIPELKELGFKQQHKLTLLAMANYADRENFELYPSYSTLAKDICASRRQTPIDHIKLLLSLGIVTKRTRRGKNGNDSNIYQITIIKFLAKYGYAIMANEKGFLQAVKMKHLASPLKSGGAESVPPLVRKAHHPSAESAPDPITDPIKKYIYIDNFKFLQKKFIEKWHGNFEKVLHEFKNYHSYKGKSKPEKYWSEKWIAWLARSKMITDKKPVDTSLLDNCIVHPVNDKPWEAYLNA